MKALISVPARLSFLLAVFLAGCDTRSVTILNGPGDSSVEDRSFVPDLPLEDVSDGGEQLDGGFDFDAEGLDSGFDFDAAIPANG
jgi:hypothetical protein